MQLSFHRLGLRALLAIGIGISTLSTASAQTTIFNFIGPSLQTYTVPTGVTSLTVKLWGGGGGYQGGSGAFIMGDLAVNPGDTLSILAGGGGGGGGNAFGGGRFLWGGGRSAIILAASGTELVTAGAGGGGGTVGAGGGGGILLGGSSTGLYGGSGGSQVAGGSGGGGAFPGGDGSAFQGGGSGGFSAGGGAGGYYGGGAGGSNSSTITGGGGGGSSYIANLTNFFGQAGSSGSPSGVAQSGATDIHLDPSASGYGGGIDLGGGSGRVVIIVNTATAPEPGTLALLALGGALAVIKRRRK